MGGFSPPGPDFDMQVARGVSVSEDSEILSRPCLARLAGGARVGVRAAERRQLHLPEVRVRGAF